MNIFNNKYILTFNDKYNKENFIIKNPLYFTINKINNKFNFKDICAYCNLIKNDNGILIDNFIYNKNLTNLLNSNYKLIKIHKYIIKKSNFYYISLALIEIKNYTNDESKIIIKNNKFKDLF